MALLEFLVKVTLEAHLRERLRFLEAVEVALGQLGYLHQPL